MEKSNASVSILQLLVQPTTTLNVSLGGGAGSLEQDLTSGVNTILQAFNAVFGPTARGVVAGATNTGAEVANALLGILAEAAPAPAPSRLDSYTLPSAAKITFSLCPHVVPLIYSKSC